MDDCLKMCKKYFLNYVRDIRLVAYQKPTKTKTTRAEVMVNFLKFKIKKNGCSSSPTKMLATKGFYTRNPLMVSIAIYTTGGTFPFTR